MVHRILCGLLAIYRGLCVARGSLARPMSPDDVTAFIRDEQILWKPAIEQGMKK
jgi:hypothetical protein